MAFSKGGSLIGQGLKKFKNWTGLGDYVINTNSLIRGDGSHLTTNGGHDSVYIYREYLGDVFTHPTLVGEFSAVSYDVNAGSARTFPWLHNIAKNYDQWVPEGIIFEFKSTTAVVTTASGGSLLIASEYDLDDAPYTSKLQMLNSAYSQESKVTDDCMHGLECDPRQNVRGVLEIRSQGQTVNDVQDYDLCRTTIATIGGNYPANTNIGSLYIHYQIRLKKQQLPKVVAASTTYAEYDLTYGDWFIASGSLLGIPNGWTGFKQIGGYDLGIYFTNFATGAGTGWVNIPNEYTGSMLRLEFLYQQDTLYQGFHLAALSANPTYVPLVLNDPNANMFDLASVSVPTFAVATDMKSNYSSTFVLMPTIAPSTPFIQYRFTSGQFYPLLANIVSTKFICRLRVTILPPDYFVLKT